MNRRALLGLMPLMMGASTLLLEAATSRASALALGGEQPGPGQPAPPFSLDGVAPSPSGEGDPIAVNLSLADFRGRWLILYFYPRDFTSGCTLEARGFQKDLKTYHQLHAEVVGISADTPQQHGTFCGEEGLAYPLLSDPKGTVSKSYGSWLAPMALRHTFLIDPQGVVRSRWLAVRPLAHSQEVLQSLMDLQAAAAQA